MIKSNVIKSSWARRFWAFPVTRIALYLLVVVALSLGLSFTLRGALHLLPQKAAQVSASTELLGMTISATSAVLAFWIMVRFVEKRPWATAGFTRQGLLTGLLSGAALGAAMLTVSIGAFWLLGFYHVTAVTPSVLLLTPLLLYLGVGVFEETLFRGYLFQTLEGRWGSGAALVATSLLFGLAHLFNPLPGATLPQRLTGPVFACLEAGLPLGAAYLLTRKWWLSIGLHWGWDYFEGPIYNCPDSGSHEPHALFQAQFSGSSILVGGPFGLESGVFLLIVGTAVGVLLLRAAIQRGQWQPRPRRTKAVPVASADG